MVTSTTGSTPFWSGLLPPPAPPSSGAHDIVTQGFANAQNYATAAFNEANNFLDNLTATVNQLATLPTIDATLTPPTITVTEFVPPVQVPDPTGLDFNSPPAPVEPVFATVEPLEYGNAPTFDVAPPAIDLSFAAPDPIGPLTAVEPELLPIVVPSAPDVTLPDVPTLYGIDLPSAPLLNLPTFTTVMPDSPLAPDYVFAFREQGYSSVNLTVLEEVLNEWLTGTSTGLAPVVEQAIWDRGRSREYFLLKRKQSDSFRQFAARGFSQPPGALSTALQDALQDSNFTLSGQSREVAINQANLEQSNRHFAIEQCVQVEKMLIDYANNMAQRAYDAAKYAQQVAIDIYHEETIAYVADIQAFSAMVEVYKAELQSELSKLEIFKSQLDAQRLVGELNVQTVQIYTAEVTAARAVVDIFRAQVEAAGVTATVNKSTIDAYAAVVGAYAEQVRAKAAEYQGYATRVQAETSKADIFKAQADAYESVVGGYSALINAQGKAKDIEIQINQTVPLQLFQARAQVFDTEVRAESSRVSSVADAYRSRVSAYTAENQGEAARVQADTGIYDSQTRLATSEGQLRVQAAQENIQALIQKFSALIEAVKGGAQVSAQLAAAALSSVNLSGQIGDSTSYGVSYGNSNSTSQGISTSSSTSNVASNSTSSIQSDSTTESTSDSNINSQAVNTNYNISNT